jgi:hypothetical protein
LVSLALLVGILCIYSSSASLGLLVLYGNDVLVGDILHVSIDGRLSS